MRLSRFPRGAIALLAALHISQAAAQEPESQLAPIPESPSGNDITRPLQRVDLRTELSGDDGEDEVVVTLRYDRPVPIGGGWRINFRGDMPFRFNDRTSDDNPLGRTGLTLGDMLLQAVFVKEIGKNEGFGFGTQLLMPTANGDAFGRGKWRLRPTAGYRWSLPSITADSFFQLLVRYDVSVAGDENRSDVSELQFSPNLEFGFPGNAYVSLFPSADIRYNFITDELFVPFNVEVGKGLGRFVLSAEGGVALIAGDNPPYGWKLELRVGYRF